MGLLLVIIYNRTIKTRKVQFRLSEMQDQENKNKKGKIGNYHVTLKVMKKIKL